MDVGMGVVVVVLVGHSETRPVMTIHMLTGKYLLLKVPRMRLMAEDLQKGVVVMEVLVVLSVVAAEVVSVTEKTVKENVTGLVGYLIAVVELDEGM